MRPDTIELSPIPASVAEARYWSRAVVAPFGMDELTDTVTLLVSELVSNVVLHAGTPCSLRILPCGERIRVEVRDHCDELPRHGADVDALAGSGRGLRLVEGLSAAHGIDPEPSGGKRIWFEVAVPDRCVDGR